MQKLERGQKGGDEGSCWMRMRCCAVRILELEVVGAGADRRGEKFTIQSRFDIDIARQV